MIGINRKDIQAILKAGAKAKGMSTSEFKAEIQATIDNIINSSDIEEQKRFKWDIGIPEPFHFFHRDFVHTDNFQFSHSCHRLSQQNG